MLTGFNHNVNYNDRVYHVQTEDSGVKAPHVITLLYVGGNILARIKTSYMDSLAHPDLEKEVQELMREQHKTVLRNLIHGDYDEVIAARSASAAFLSGPTPINQAEDAYASIDPSTTPIAELTADEATSRKAVPSGDQACDPSIFAPSIAERPLDEVILSYLNASSDAEPPAEKKPAAQGEADADKATVTAPKSVKKP